MLSALKQFESIKNKDQKKIYWQNLDDSALSLAIASAASDIPLLVITPDILTIHILEQELKFYLGKKSKLPILVFPDWETLPYDHFSPHEDIVSQRLRTLYQLTSLNSGIILVAATTLLHRLPPKNYVESNSFILQVNDTFDLVKFRKRLENHGYTCVSKVMQHGEFAVRGSIIDLFPIGNTTPFRIDLLATKVDSIRTFDPNTQRSQNKINSIEILPAKEYPHDDEAINRFRTNWRKNFSGDPLNCPIYQSIIDHESYPGIEYYLPLFFETTNTLFDYLPSNSTIIRISDNEKILKKFWQEINERYQQLCHDQTHPLLPPINIYTTLDQFFANQNNFSQILVNPEKYQDKINKNYRSICFKTKAIQDIAIDLSNFIQNHPQARTLFVAESTGRREALLELLKTANLNPTLAESWQDFIENPSKTAITVAPITQGLHLISPDNQTEILVITETQIFGKPALEYRTEKNQIQNAENIVRNLTELQIGAPVVHFEHGIGRYQGLKTLLVNDYETEFLVLEYAEHAILYVPVANLNLISRYTGLDTEHILLSKLSSKQWEKTKRQAQAKIHDVAVELLEIYTQRKQARGFAFAAPDADYLRFVSGFAFTETPDQKRAIQEVIDDMTSHRPMDRLICGDVGFGKTEIAMRAAFLAVHSNKQVAILTPTTLLAKQHFTNFQDRFADWPIKIELFSRFRSTQEKNIIANLANGKIDLVIGTHKLLQKNVKFKDLGLLIIDEEHRFGVKQKEHIKKLFPGIDILTLTATPIPRTLNMAFAHIRDFSIIATPPAKRLAIKTFIHQRNDYLIKEAIMREILRGGQVYFLHNDIVTLEKTARELQQLVPSARLAIAHGQMRKQTLEQVMNDFYHLRTNLLVCTTIIESGIDIPTTNTIIIDRADRFGLAQLHQLRGRVGRSHHQAYAYLITPPPSILTPDAKKRLEAITSMEDLGAGFVLATHDLEIRGAGELLGEEQSGAIHSIGFNLYMELLEQAVNALKIGKEPDLETTIKPTTEIDLPIPALIPEKYIDDMALRLVLYKRIANAKNQEELNDLQVEMIDRFGLLPEYTKNLFAITTLKLKAMHLGIFKIIIGANNKGTVEFSTQPNIDSQAIINLIREHKNSYQLKGPHKLQFTLQPTSNKIEYLNILLDTMKILPRKDALK